MPFKNSAQMRVCISKSQDDIAKGQRPKWNCEEYACHTGEDQSPMCKRIRNGGAIGSKIHQGSRGGLYFEIDGKKFYISERNRDAMVRKFGIEGKPVRLSPYSSSKGVKKTKKTRVSQTKGKKSPSKRTSQTKRKSR